MNNIKQTYTILMNLYQNIEPGEYKSSELETKYNINIRNFKANILKYRCKLDYSVV